MSKISGFLLLVAGLATAAYVLPTNDTAPDDSKPQRASSAAVTAIETPAAVATAKPAAAFPALRLDSEKAASKALPDLPVAAKVALSTSAGRGNATFPPAATNAKPLEPAVPLVKTIAAIKPMEGTSRADLARDIQRELKRVGCYDGEISGEWTPGTRKGMKSFIERVNATLPIDEPDHILKTLVQGHPGSACGNSCPAGQALSGDGRCIPTAILAQTKKRLIPTTREASANSPRPKAWETTVLAMAPLPIQPQATRQAEPALAARSEAPAGRMALAGPKLELVQPAAPAAEAPKTVLQRIEANPPTTSAPAKGSTAAAAKAPRLAAVLPLADETVNRTPPPITQAPPRADPPVRNTAVSRPASPSAPPRPRVVYAPYNGPAFVAQARTSFNASIFVKLAREGR